MRIGVFGTGYVGLVTGVCFADHGHDVVCRDIDEEKVAKLRRGESPIYEPGLTDLLERNIEEGRISFTLDAKEALQDVDVVIIAVGTPAREDGSTNLDYFFAAAAEIAEHAEDGIVVVDKSTVPVTTAKHIEDIFTEKGVEVHVVSNPETLREGSAVQDFMSPDRIIIGARTEKAFEAMRTLYGPFMMREDRLIEMSPESAELVKYGANTLLATRISFINFMSQLAAKTGADIREVRKGIGSDNRIGMQFLYPGPGFGGSCFPKDVASLGHQASELGVSDLLPRATLEMNRLQKEYVYTLVKHALGTDKTVAVWGLAFKARTDDVRESASITLCKRLLDDDVTVLVDDPEAVDNFLTEVPGVQAADRTEMLREADVLVVMTEWDSYRTLSEEELSLLAGKHIVDARNVLTRPDVQDALAEHDIRYTAIGIPGRNA